MNDWCLILRKIPRIYTEFRMSNLVVRKEFIIRMEGQIHFDLSYELPFASD